MAKKKTAKERREELWKKTINDRMNKSKKEKKYEDMATVVGIKETEDDRQQQEYENLVKELEEKNKEDSIKPTAYINLSNYFSEDKAKFVRGKLEKSRIQLAAENIDEKYVYEMPEFLIDESMVEERSAYIEKLKLLAKRRFSLTAIADALQTNNYSALDEYMAQREEIMSKIVEIDNAVENNSQKVRMFSRFKHKIGDVNSRIYSDQEDNIKDLLEYIEQCGYIESAKEKLPKAIQEYIEPYAEYVELKSRIQELQNGNLTNNQKKKLFEDIVNFSIGCREMYGKTLMNDDEYMSETTRKVSIKMVDVSNSIIEKSDEIYKSTNQMPIMLETLQMFEDGIKNIEETILKIEIEHSYDDVVANVLDNPNFNAACKIESVYFAYELERAAEILENLVNRYELTAITQKCRALRDTIKSREEAYSTIEKLVAGNSRPTLKVDIKDDEGR